MVDLGTNKKVSTPLPAVVGQTDLKRVLLALAVEPGLSGALLRGEKGTAKSTSVRALADLLPEQAVVADCPYGCPPPDATEAAAETGGAAAAERCADCRDREDPPVATRPAPLVTLPLGATRDRVVGTLSVADALDGEAEFDPGLLARANRGILYVDEVNLLPDHLVDVLLDAAAAGTNRVERDGVSVAHPADFTLVGTMNPEEGELRPQLRDRFDLCVDVASSDEIDERVEILDRVVDGADGGDRDLRAEFASETAALRERVRDARDRRPAIPEEFKRDIAECCRDAGVDGHRADFAVARAARAFAALDGRPKVLESDVAAAAEHALAHRLRSAPFDEATDPEAIVDEHFDDAAEGDGEPGSDGEGREAEAPDADESDGDGNAGADGEADGDGEGPGAGDEGAPADRDGGDGERDGADGGGEDRDRDGADRAPADGPRDPGPRDGDAGDADDPDRSPGGATAADSDD
ncbi:ATP-binding protein, partial [Halorubrum rutilum]